MFRPGVGVPLSLFPFVCFGESHARRVRVSRVILFQVGVQLRVFLLSRGKIGPFRRSNMRVVVTNDLYRPR